MTHITLKTIYDAVQDLRDEVRSTYVTKDEFTPIKLIVYGMISTVLMAVGGAVISIVVKVNGQ